MGNGAQGFAGGRVEHGDGATIFTGAPLAVDVQLNVWVHKEAPNAPVAGRRRKKSVGRAIYWRMPITVKDLYMMTDQFASAELQQNCINCCA
jgi:hypothetical protein